jgi:hypothetical protein
MKSRWAARVLKMVIFATIVIAVIGLVVLQLWNSLIPDIFGLRPISFWQALGLLALSWILFGRFGTFRGPGGCSSRWRHRMAERLEQMSPEERDKFRQGLESRCGRGMPPASSQAGPDLAGSS